MFIHVHFMYVFMTRNEVPKKTNKNWTASAKHLSLTRSFSHQLLNSASPQLSPPTSSPSGSSPASPGATSRLRSSSWAIRTSTPVSSESKSTPPGPPLPGDLGGSYESTWMEEPLQATGGLYESTLREAQENSVASANGVIRSDFLCD